MKNPIFKDLVSIIIRTKNEEKWIDNCLKSVFNQNYKNFEIILVDNESKDNTVKIAKKYKIKILKITKFKPGLAINEGIRKAKGKIIVCLSGHCIPVNQSWLKNLVQGLNKKNIAGIYGRQEPLSFSSDLDKRDLINTFGLDRRVQTNDTFFHNANSAFRKNLWKNFPFDEQVTNIEDRVWGEKVIENGFKIIYEPKASVYHYHGINHDQNLERAKNIVKILDGLKSTSTKRNLKLKKKLSIAAVIPLRGKTKFFGNTSLLERTIVSAQKSNLIDEVYVFSDDEDTIKLSKKIGAKAPFRRPKNLSEEYILINDILKYSIKKLENIKKYDLIVCLEETYPFRKKELIDAMINKLINEDLDSVFAGKLEQKSIWIKNNNETKIVTEGFMPRNLREEKAIISLFGLCFVCYPEIINTGDLFSGKTAIYQINDPISHVEIRDNESLRLYKDLLINHE